MSGDDIGISADTPEELVAKLSSPLLLSKTGSPHSPTTAATPTLPTEPIPLAPAPLMLNPLLLNPFMLSTTLGNKSGSNLTLGGDGLLNVLKTPNATLPEVSLNFVNSVYWKHKQLVGHQETL